MIITVSEGDTLVSISQKYSVPADKIASDNGIGIEDSLVIGQSLIVLPAKEFLVPSKDTTVQKMSTETEKSEKELYRNNFFLGGRPEIPAYSYVVLEYEKEPEVSKIIGGYAYEFISVQRLLSVINYLTYIMPFTYGFTNEGSLVSPNDEFIIETAKRRGVMTLMHVSTLTEEGVFDSGLPSRLFANPEYVNNLLSNIMQTVENKGYDGVDVDFEFLPVSEKENYIDFLAQLSERLKETGKILVVALPPKTSDDQRGMLYEGIDYGEIGKYADYVLLMTYEYGYRFGPPLAIAPIPSLRRVVEYALTRIPRRKLLLGISNYGYDWSLPFVRGESDAPSISTVEAVNLARRYGSVIMFDEYSKAPYFFYTDENGNRHEVWFEDARSFEAKLNLIEEYNLPGGFIWELMRENPQGYVTINSYVSIM